MKHIHNFDTVSAFTESYSGEDYIEPWVSYTKENQKVDYNKSEEEKKLKDPLTFEILTGGQINPHK